MSSAVSQPVAAGNDPGRKRILFVDDEVSILDALRSVLRRERQRWDVRFATSGEEALEIMRAGPIDVLVSDMRMPGMDGAELLARTKLLQPDAARIVLSGHAEQSALARVLPIAHQYLAKPCEIGTLRDTLARTCQLRELLADRSLRAFVGERTRLPSAPAIYFELLEKTADARASISEIAEVVERDPGVSAKLLQIVNSAFFGARRPIVSIERAVGYLGLAQLRSLVLGAGALSITGELAVAGSLAELQQHAVRVARATRRLAPPQHAEAAFAAGLLHEVGKVVLAMARPAELRAILERTSDGTSFDEAERALSSVSHAALGAYLLGLWGLPYPIVEAVAYQRRPSDCAGQPEVLTALHVADAFVHASITGREPHLDMVYLTRGDAAAHLDDWRGLVAAELEHAV